MKTVSVGIIGTILIYFGISVEQHTWDLMKYSSDAGYWFCCGMLLSWGIGGLIDMTTPNKEN